MSKIDYTCVGCAKTDVCKYQKEFQEIYARDQEGDLLIAELPEFLIVRCKYYEPTVKSK